MHAGPPVTESWFEEIKRYMRFDAQDEATLRTLAPLFEPDLARIADLFYSRILEHEPARKVLEGGESQVGRLKGTLIGWMHTLFAGPWDASYLELRSRIGRVHVRIALPQHYMFAAMGMLRAELFSVVVRLFAGQPERIHAATLAISRVLDVDLAIMLHTYREDLQAQQVRIERLSTFGQLVGSIGHELRNPLGVMESSLYIIKNRLGHDERLMKHANRIGEQITLANNIISALLDLIRDKPLQRERTQLQRILIEVQQSLTIPDGVSLQVHGIENLPDLEGDPTQLRQALRNLLENALHAVGQAGEILVLARWADGHIELSIADSGPGVTPDIRKRLFEPLISSKTNGVGLGLALVKRFIERHGGSVTYVPDPAKATGACFMVRLPAPAPNRPEDGPAKTEGSHG